LFIDKGGRMSRWNTSMPPHRGATFGLFAELWAFPRNTAAQKHPEGARVRERSDLEPASRKKAYQPMEKPWHFPREQPYQYDPGKQFGDEVKREGAKQSAPWMVSFFCLYLLAPSGALAGTFAFLCFPSYCRRQRHTRIKPRVLAMGCARGRPFVISRGVALPAPEWAFGGILARFSD